MKQNNLLADSSRKPCIDFFWIFISTM